MKRTFDNRTFDNILTYSDLQQILADDCVTIVKASATWCGPCKKIENYVNDIFSKTSSNVRMVYLDIDTAIDLSNYLRIRKVPTFISFVGEDKMDVYEGSQKDMVDSFFRKVEMRAKLLSNKLKNNI